MSLKHLMLQVVATNQKHRQIGKSTANAKLAKKNKGVVLTHNADYAKWIEGNLKVPARSINSIYLSGALNVPVFIDHHAMDTLLLDAVKEIESLENENRFLREKLHCFV